MIIFCMAGSLGATVYRCQQDLQGVPSGHACLLTPIVAPPGLNLLLLD